MFIGAVFMNTYITLDVFLSQHDADIYDIIKVGDLLQSAPCVGLIGIYMILSRSDRDIYTILSRSDRDIYTILSRFDRDIKDLIKV
jgi:hypothetical protein